MSNEFERLIQIGVVTAADRAAHKVRVKFQDTGLISDWLSVLKNAPGVSVNHSDGHSHTTSVSLWMPGINDTVLVVYLPIFNSDGFVIGGI